MRCTRASAFGADARQSVTRHECLHTLLERLETLLTERVELLDVEVAYARHVGDLGDEGLVERELFAHLMQVLVELRVSLNIDVAEGGERGATTVPKVLVAQAGAIHVARLARVHE